MQVSNLDGVITVVKPLPGSPTLKAGILECDQILIIDGLSTQGLTADMAVERLRGALGTKSKLVIRQASETRDREYIITREPIYE